MILVKSQLQFVRLIGIIYTLLSITLLSVEWVQYTLQ